MSETPAEGEGTLGTMSGGDFVASDFGLGPSPAPSRRASEGRLTASSSMNSFRSPSPDKQTGPWKKFVSGARRLVDAVADIVDLEDDDDISEKYIHSRNVSSISGLDLDGNGKDDLYSTVKEEPGVPLGDLVDPVPLYGNMKDDDDFIVETSEESKIISVESMKGISSHMPLRHRQKRWTLLYSTLRDGISMQTLLRKSKGKAPTILIIRDMNKYVFGAFCSESWRISSRYYGTGETFIFKVEPEPAVWHWWWKKSSEVQNDFFMWGSHEAIAVGGAGGYAIWLDKELSQGISRTSQTFGNSSLSSTEEFSIGAVELWGLE